MTSAENETKPCGASLSANCFYGDAGCPVHPVRINDDYLDELHGAQLEAAMDAHDIGDVKPSILDDADRIGGENWTRQRLAMAIAQARIEEPVKRDMALPMIADFVAGDIAELTEFLGRTDITDEQQRRAGTVRVLLEMAAWYLSAPDLPRANAVSVNHEADSLEQVAQYARLHSTEPFQADPDMCAVDQTLHIPGVYTPITVQFNRRKGDAL